MPQRLRDLRITSLRQIQVAHPKRTVMTRMGVSRRRPEDPQTMNLPHLHHQTPTPHHPMVRIVTRAKGARHPVLFRTISLPHQHRTTMSRRLTVKTKAIQTQAVRHRLTPPRTVCLLRIWTPHRPRGLRTIPLRVLHLHLPPIRMLRPRKTVMTRTTCLSALQTICHPQMPRPRPWLRVWVTPLLPRFLPRTPKEG
ncbi:hypothetical protein AB1N83_005992 [Pleurotus pulmonarius]